MIQNQHLYQEIYQKLLDRINNGEISDGQRLPSEKELAEEFGVSRITAKKAMNMLAEEGIIIRRPGLGSFACIKKGSKPEQKVSRTGKRLENNKIIGLVMEDFSSSYGMELLRSMEHTVGQSGGFLCVKRSLGDQLLEEKAIDELMELNVDGIIVMPTHGEHYNTEILRIVVDGFPVVFIDRYLSGIPASYVGTDNCGASKILTEYLIKKGHTNIAMLTAPANDAITINDRISGFINAHKSANLKFNKENLLDSIRSTIPNLRSEQNTKEDFAQIESFLKSHQDITAIVATEYDIAELAKAVCKKINLRIPEELSIACFDNPRSNYSDCYFTHMCQNEWDIGKSAINILYKQVLANGDKVQPEQKIFEAELIEGATVKDIKRHK